MRDLLCTQQPHVTQVIYLFTGLQNIDWIPKVPRVTVLMLPYQIVYRVVMLRLFVFVFVSIRSSVGGLCIGC